MQERFHEEETIQDRLMNDSEREMMQERVECDEGETVQERFHEEETYRID